MTQEEIRKLLGGYATNTLTERERTELFQAALEDQELFDALQNEDTLRELLADPISREQIRQALQPARRIPWMRRRWLIGTAAVAAAVVGVGIFISQRKPAPAPALQIASSQIAQGRIEPKLEAPRPAPVIPAPAISAKARKRATRDLGRSAAQLAAPAAAGLALPEASPKQGLIGGVAAAGALYDGPLVRYSVLRSGPSGDAVRIEVVSEVAGTLALYQIDDAGQWQRVFPVNSPGLTITANAPYQIPDDPIALRGNQDRLRLVIQPAAAHAPLVVEIAIRPN